MPVSSSRIMERKTLDRLRSLYYILYGLREVGGNGVHAMIMEMNPHKTVCPLCNSVNSFGNRFCATCNALLM